MSDTSVFPIILIIERERGRLQGLTLKAELENRDNPKKLFAMIILFTINLQDVQVHVGVGRRGGRGGGVGPLSVFYRISLIFKFRHVKSVNRQNTIQSHV